MRKIVWMTVLLFHAIGILAWPVVGAAALLYPMRPVRLIVPTTAGGATDLLARVISHGLTEIWGRQVIVDNRPGGHGIVAMGLLANAPSDGHTLLLGNIGVIAINAGLYAKLPYDTMRDFTPVSLTTKQPFLLGINANVPAKDLREFIQLVKSKPGQMSFGSSGNGSGTHVAMELLKQRMGMDIVHVPYKGFGIMINDLISGQVQACIVGASALLPHMRSGKVRGLAVSHNKRLSIAAAIPTFAEAGVADFEVYQWQGLMASARVAPQIITKISDDIARVMRTPEVRERMTDEGLEVIASSPKEFATFIQAEIERWRKVMKQANIRID